MAWIKQENPFVVPTTDGKIIREHFGAASLGGDQLSLAHMTAPPGWEEPSQIPEFDEYTLVFKGRKQAFLEGKKVTLNPGESLFVSAGQKVRYANPFSEPCEYVSFCLPAFTPDRVHRE